MESPDSFREAEVKVVFSWNKEKKSKYVFVESGPWNLYFLSTFYP